MELDGPTHTPHQQDTLPQSSLPLKPVQEEPNTASSQQASATNSSAASPAPAPSAEAGKLSEGFEPTSAEASAAATLGMLTAGAVSAQQHSPTASQPSFTAVNTGSPQPGQGAQSPVLPYPAVPNPLPPGYNKDQPICANCSTQTTPLWRRSHDSTHILCNACALFFKMKGRPRPISLKTDVIKSRNRSKGKSSSKDRSGPGAAKAIRTGHERGESTSRSRESGVVGSKSGPGPAEDDDAEMDGRSHSFGDASLDSEGGRKARKTAGGSPYGMMAPYPAAVPGPYGYPYGYPHPHGHAPYPPTAARARSRSSDANRRATSLDSRGRVDGTSTPPGAGPGSPAGYPYPPPPGYVHPEGAPPPGPYGYPAYYGYPPPGQAGHYPAYAYPPGAHPGTLAHLQPPAITHAQSDSRSRSPVPGASTAESTPRSGRSSASASPPHPSTHPAAAAGGGPGQHWPHPNPNYHLHQPHTHSPLGGARAAAAVPPSAVRGSSATPALSSERGAGGVTLAPIASSEGTAAALNGAAPAGPRPHLPSIGSVGAPRSSSPSSHIPRHTALFESRFPPGEGASATGSVSSTPVGSNEASANPSGTNSRERGHSVSSTNSASVSGSSEGVRSPEVSHRHTLPPVGAWGKTPGNWTHEDERRGRPEKRFDELPQPQLVKGKTREIDEIDELDEDDEGNTDAGNLSRAQSHAGTASRPSSLHRTPLGGEDHRRMVGVETGLNELRMADHHHHPERGRSRGQPMSTGHRSQSTSRARGLSTGRGSGGGSVPRSSSSGRKTVAELEAENARLRAKNNELAFINGLMQSRLGQLEGPGKVPSLPMSSLAGVEEAYTDSGSPSVEEDVTMDAPEEDKSRPPAEDELAQIVREDPAIRAKLLDLLRSQQTAH